MNNSKENILKRIAAAGMPEYAYPDFGYEPQHFDDPAAMFAQRLRAAGGEAVWLDGATTLDEVVRRCYPDAKSVASALPEVTVATVNPDRVEDPWKNTSKKNGIEDILIYLGMTTINMVSTMTVIGVLKAVHWSRSWGWMIAA